MDRLRALLLMTALSAMALNACNLPRSGKAATPTPTDNVPTAAAKTVSAQLTAMAPLATDTPYPTATSGTVPTLTQVGAPTTPPLAPTSVPCDRGSFLSDVTIPDGAQIQAGQSFSKTWRIVNNGSCTWSPSYALVFDHGDAMEGPASQPLGVTVAPQQSVDITVNLKAPATAGTYKGFWKLRNAQGAVFGVGLAANTAFWVEIASVLPTLPPPPAPETVIYDMALDYCSAIWMTGASSDPLPCPGASDNPAGFVIRVDNPTLQNSINYPGKAIETHPQWVDNGVISGKYPALVVQSGYKFRATIGCLNGGPGCDYKAQVNYRAGGGPLTPLGEWSMKYTDAPKVVLVDLSALSGQSIQLVLAATANGPSTQDWAVWFSPSVIK